MNLNVKFFSLLIIVIVLFTLKSNPCTTFCIKDKNGKNYFGRNLDWETGVGHIQINLRNVQKTSFIAIHEKKLSWTSKYGSISFNQFGREFPYGGMNEAGLVVEQMFDMKSFYPSFDDRYGIEEVQWIQYHLDVSSSVDDVIKSDKLIRISYTSLAPLHFLISDIEGNAAIIEFVKGKMVVYTGKDLKYPVLANSTYHESLKYYTKLKEDARSKIFNNNGDISSLDRFAKAAYMVSTYNEANDNIVDYSFSILDSVSLGDYTQWSIVYDPVKKEIYYKTQKNRNTRKIEFNNFDFSNTSKRLYLDIDDNSNNLTDFKEYSFENNYKLVEAAFNIDFLNEVPYKKEFAQYPDDMNNTTPRKLSACVEMTRIIYKSPIIFHKSKLQKILKADDEFFYEENKLINTIDNLTYFRFSHATKYGELICEKYPQSVRALLVMSLVYIEKEKMTLAENYLEKAKKLMANENKKFPSYFEIYFILTKSTYEKSKTEVTSIINNEKDYTHSEDKINEVGYVLMNRKRFNDAIEIFKINVEKFPDSANAYESLGEAYLKAGNKELAINNYEKSLELDPKNENAKKVLKEIKN